MVVSRPILPLLVFGLLSSSAVAHAVDVGSRAPDIGLPDLDGRPVRLSSYRGKVLIVDVWASWCGPCRDEMPTLQRLYARYRRHGLRVVGVSVDRSEQGARDFVARTGVRFRNVHDPESRTPRRYGLSTMPTSWIIDHRGIVRHVNAGFRSSDAAEMERVVRRLLDALPSERSAGAENTEDVEEPEAIDANGDDEASPSREEDPEEDDGAAPADAPPPASRSEAGRSGGLCDASTTRSPHGSAAFLLFLCLWQRRTRRKALTASA
jgi:peroxiredoxin